MTSTAAAVDDQTVTLTHPSGARAEIRLFGATVTGFYTAAEPTRNVLFVSTRAALDGSKPIRGGIPLVFPVFGSAPGFPNHGFARITDWTLRPEAEGPAAAAAAAPAADPATSGATPTVATFTLEASPSTQAVFAHDFGLRYELRLYPDALVTALHVTNRGATDMAFHALLHTYFTVEDVRNGGCEVEGLTGLTYQDKVTGARETETRARLGLDKETDSVYANAPAQVLVRLRQADGSFRVITIDKTALLNGQTPQPCDVVVWNPWVDKAKAMSDFGDDEYLRMVCVEPGRVSEQQRLAAGDVYTLQQSIRVGRAAL